MFDAALTAELQTIRGRYPQPKAALVPVLRRVQKHLGWLKPEAREWVAEFLSITPMEVHEVTSFYPMLFDKPVGRHVIFLCDSVSCWIMGLEALRAHLKQKLNVDFGETSEDHAYTLLPVACLGACDHAPALLLDGELHGDLNAQKLDALVGRRG